MGCCLRTFVFVVFVTFVLCDFFVVWFGVVVAFVYSHSSHYVSPCTVGLFALVVVGCVFVFVGVFAVDVF